MTRKMVLAGVGLAGVLAAGTATAALADTLSSSPSGTAQQKSQDAARRCMQEPRRAARVDRLIAKFSGDAKTRGSVQWLQARAAKAQANDAALAAIIKDQAKIRQSQLATLKLRKDELGKIAQWCSAKGHPTG